MKYKWKKGDLFFDKKLNTYILAIISEEMIDDVLCIGTIYGQTEKICDAIVDEIVQSHNILVDLQL